MPSLVLTLVLTKVELDFWHGFIVVSRVKVYLLHAGELYKFNWEFLHTTWRPPFFSGGGKITSSNVSSTTRLYYYYFSRKTQNSFSFLIFNFLLFSFFNGMGGGPACWPVGGKAPSN